MYKFRFMILLGFLMPLSFETNNRMIGSFFVNAKFSLPAKELAEKKYLVCSITSCLGTNVFVFWGQLVFT